MYLRQFFIEGLGHGSYVVGDEAAGVGAVIDPRRDFDVYVGAAQEAGLAIAHVLETHTHNDYVSGAKELAAATGATLWASGANGGAGLRYPFRPLTEGDAVRVGAITLRVVETPGHTPEHLAYCAYEGDAGEDAAPVAVFSGGSLMVGGAGRADLSGADRTQELARAQFAGLRRLLALPRAPRSSPPTAAAPSPAAAAAPRAGRRSGSNGAPTRWPATSPRATPRASPGACWTASR